MSNKMKWIKCSESLPKSGQRVFISFLNRSGNRWHTTGFYTDAFTMSAEDFDDPADYEYCDKRDEYFIESGWYEEGVIGEYFYDVPNVSHWAAIEPPTEVVAHPTER